MTDIKTGGLAYPGCVAFSASDDMATSENIGQPGMTFRDRVALEVFARFATDNDRCTNYWEDAEQAFKAADAFISVRDREVQP